MAPRIRRANLRSVGDSKCYFRSQLAPAHADDAADA
eukprot:CAMPEP_0185781234 /NCGR_PEP_ID=MMETSP1174-20130828/101629_1 /TAXON_ID=35687 /ORGANISM="Dictyocha speculum, Strain CCMP1381" /LENGTH=35 /DNA_ID= /DNA_START= /DNA_END= /DNA_ORIENTATION=